MSERARDREAAWNGLCSSGQHGLDYRGQVCDLCRFTPTTHVLWGGHALCDDKRLCGVPGEWPDGQRWISLKDVVDGAAAPGDRCETCWTKVPGRVDGLRTGRMEP